LAWVELLQNYSADAERDATEATTHAPARPDILLNLAHAYLLNSKKLSQAQTIYRENKDKSWPDEERDEVPKTFAGSVRADFKLFRLLREIGVGPLSGPDEQENARREKAMHEIETLLPAQ
jgi:hypothetical protein